MEGCSILACKSLQCWQDLSPFWTTLLTTYDTQLAKHMVYLSILAAAANVVVIVIVVSAVIIANAIVPIAAAALAFVLCRPLVLLLHRWLLPVALPLLLASLLRLPLLVDYCVRHALSWWSGR